MTDRRRIALVTVAAAVLAALTTSCGSAAGKPRPGSPAQSEAARCTGSGGGLGKVGAASATTSGVNRLDLTLIDRSRPTPAVPSRTGFPCRVLPTEIRSPAGATGPLPLIVVAHGLDGSPTSLGPLLDSWARAGYVVTAPTFPTTEKDGGGTSLPSSNVDQAADITFVIDRLLEQSNVPASNPLRGLIDAKRIGVAGMSLGGETVYGLIANTCCEDRRVSAAIVMAGVHREYPGARYEHNHIPVLLEQGDADRGYHNSQEAYVDLVPPKWFITLHGSTHAPPFEIPLGPEAPLVRATTTDFWNLYLKHDDAAATRIVDEVAASHGRATLRRALR